MKLLYLMKAFQRGFKIKDSITASLFSGLLGTLSMGALNISLWRNGKSEILFGHMAGSIFVNSYRTNQRKNYLLGEIVHLITGSAVAIPLNYIFKKTGKDNHLLKGAVYGTLTMEVIYGFGQKIGLISAKPHLTKTHLAMFLNHFIYGVVSAQALVTFSDPSAFPEQSKTTVQNTQRTIAQPIYSDTNYEVENSNTLM